MTSSAWIADGARTARTTARRDAGQHEEAERGEDPVAVVGRARERRSTVPMMKTTPKPSVTETDATWPSRIRHPKADVAGNRDRDGEPADRQRFTPATLPCEATQREPIEERFSLPPIQSAAAALFRWVHFSSRLPHLAADRRDSSVRCRATSCAWSIHRRARRSKSAARAARCGRLGDETSEGIRLRQLECTRSTKGTRPDRSRGPGAFNARGGQSEERSAVRPHHVQL